MTEHPAPAPNVVVCLCDQLRAFEVGCYGNPVIRTPNIDRLASEGVRVETAVTSFPVCMAARSVALSGQYNRRCTGGVSNVGTLLHGGRSYMPQYPDPGRPHLKEPTLPELLRDRGYHTRAIGKWHIHSWPHDIGFDDYVIPRVHHCHTGQHFIENGGPEFVPAGYSVDYECERVEQFLGQRRNAAQPFFLYYNISPPHCPISDAPEEYLTLYRPEDIPLRPNVDLSRPLPDQDHWLKVYRWDFRYYNFHLPYTEDLPGDYTLRRAIAEYYGLTTWVDDCVGRLMAALEHNRLAENTIVVFTSDHGDYLGSHNRVQKGDLHEESIRIPLIFRWPRALRPRVVRDGVAGLVSLAPTLLDLIGIDPSAHMHGQSLTPALREDAPAPDYAIIETAASVGIRSASHLYSLPFVPGTRQLAGTPNYFFDMTDDPWQMRNLAGASEQINTAWQLDKALRHWDAVTPWMEE